MLEMLWKLLRILATVPLTTACFDLPTLNRRYTASSFSPSVCLWTLLTMSSVNNVRWVSRFSDMPLSRHCSWINAKMGVLSIAFIVVSVALHEIMKRH